MNNPLKKGEWLIKNNYSGMVDIINKGLFSKKDKEIKKANKLKAKLNGLYYLYLEKYYDKQP